MSLFNKPILILGATGFLGRKIAAGIQASGGQVVGVGRRPDPQVFDRYIQTDISDTSSLAAIAPDVGSVIFLASSILPTTKIHAVKGFLDDNLTRTLSACETLMKGGVERIVFGSSGGTIYGYSSDVPLVEQSAARPTSAYGVTKLAIEKFLAVLGAQYGVATTSLRVSNAYGPGHMADNNQGFIAAAFRSMYSNKVMQIWGDGSVVRDFVYVEDVANAFVKTVSTETSPPIVNIGSGQGVSLRDVLQQIGAVDQKGATLSVEYSQPRPVDIQKNVLDISLAKSALGWSPTTSLEEGLAKTNEWWREVDASSDLPVHVAPDQ